MSIRYGWDPMDGPERPFSESKGCVGCGTRFWPPEGKPYADFCNPCWTNVAAGRCPRKGCQGKAVIDKTGGWPVVRCVGTHGNELFGDRHGSAPRKILAEACEWGPMDPSCPRHGTGCQTKGGTR